MTRFDDLRDLVDMYGRGLVDHAQFESLKADILGANDPSAVDGIEPAGHNGTEVPHRPADERVATSGGKDPHAEVHATSVPYVTSIPNEVIRTLRHRLDESLTSPNGGTAGLDDVLHEAPWAPYIDWRSTDHQRVVLRSRDGSRTYSLLFNPTLNKWTSWTDSASTSAAPTTRTPDTSTSLTFSTKAIENRTVHGEGVGVGTLRMSSVSSVPTAARPNPWQSYEFDELIAWSSWIVVGWVVVALVAVVGAVQTITVAVTAYRWSRPSGSQADLLALVHKTHSAHITWTVVAWLALAATLLSAWICYRQARQLHSMTAKSAATRFAPWVAAAAWLVPIVNIIGGPFIIWRLSTMWENPLQPPSWTSNRDLRTASDLGSGGMVLSFLTGMLLIGAFIAKLVAAGKSSAGFGTADQFRSYYSASAWGSSLLAAAVVLIAASFLVLTLLVLRETNRGRSVR